MDTKPLAEKTHAPHILHEAQEDPEPWKTLMVKVMACAFALIPLFIGLVAWLGGFAAFGVYVGLLAGASLFVVVPKMHDRKIRHDEHKDNRAYLAKMIELSEDMLRRNHSVEIVSPAGHVVRGVSPDTIPERWSVKNEFNGVEALPSPAQYPVAPPFASMRSLIQPGRMILGYSSAGMVTGDVTDLLSMAFVGKPGTGKSTGLMYYLANLLVLNASVYVLDPHGSLNELSQVLPYYGDMQDIYTVLPAIYEEISEREELWRNHPGQTRSPLLVLIDEIGLISAYEQENKPSRSVLALARKIVTENRKHNCFCILAAPSLPADTLPTVTRDNLSSRLVYNTTNAHAQLIGLDKESRDMLLPLLRKAPQGTAILDVSRRPTPEIVALPLTTVDDIKAILDQREIEDIAPLIVDAEPVTFELDRAVFAWTNGANSVRKLAGEMQVTNDRAYKLIQQLKQQGKI